MTTVTGPSAGVDLAQEPDFSLGELLVSPSACRVRVGARDQRIEPRVMQVLVALARQAGRTVTRDQLIDACWDGRIVSDDAVTRVVAQVRNLARSVDPAPFVLETVPKVGFRLLATGGAGEGASRRPVPRTRISTLRGSGRSLALIAAGLALLIAAVGAWTLWRSSHAERLSAQNGRVDVMLFEPLRPDPALQRLSATLSDSVVRILASNGVATGQRPLRRDDGVQVQLALMRAAQGDLRGAEADLARADLGPDFSRDARWTIAVWWEDPQTALPKVRALGKDATDPASLACLDRYLGELPSRKAAAARGLPANCAGLDPQWRIRLLARQGDLDGAYAEMARPIPNWRRDTYFLYYPEMKAFRGDLRFMPLARRLGLVDYWLKSNRWPDFCADPDLPYDCRAAARSTPPP